MVSRLFAALLAVALLIPQTASAAGFGAAMDAVTGYKKGSIKFGKLTVTPYANVSEKYDDNIYLTPRDKDGHPSLGTGPGVMSSWITDVSGGLRARLPLTDMHQFEVGYDAQGLFYSKYPDVNNAFNQRVDGAYMYKGPMGITGKLSDSYVNTSDPATSELTERNKRWQNTTNATVEYAPQGGRLFVAADGSHMINKYIDPAMGASLNRYEDIIGGRVGYQLQPKTRVYVGYDRQVAHYAVVNVDNHKNSKSHLINAGIEGQLLPKLKGQVQGGVVMRKYDEASQDRKGYVNQWTVATNLMYRPVERTDITLGVSRSLQESVYATNRFYTATSAVLDVRHKLPCKLSASAGLGWGLDKYPESATSLPPVSQKLPVRRDDIYSERVGLDYDALSWLTVGASYMHRDRFSTLSREYNYRDNITSVTAKLTF